MTNVQKIENMKQLILKQIEVIKNDSKEIRLDKLTQVKNLLLGSKMYRPLYSFLFKECVCSGIPEIKEV